MTPSEHAQKFTAEQPEAAKLIKEDGFKAGKAEGMRDGESTGKQSERDRAKQITEACGENHALATKAIVAGHDVAAVKLAAEETAATKAKAAADAKAQADAIAKKDAEIAQLKEKATFNQGEQGAVNTRGAGAAKAPEKPAASDSSDPEAAAKAEWAKMSADQKAEWLDEETFVGLRKAEAKGQVKSSNRAA